MGKNGKQQKSHAAKAQAASAAPAEETAAAVQPFLGRELRVELSDGRVLVGTLIAYEGTGDLLLRAAVEQCAFKDGELAVHELNIIAIPFRHVKALHRRLPGHEPITLSGNSGPMATAAGGAADGAKEQPVPAA